MRPVLIAGLVALAACAAPQPSVEETHAIGAGALKSYLDAINTNDPRQVLRVMTDDVVMMPPHEPALVGKAKVRLWVEGYFGAYAARWEKTAEDIVVDSDHAYQRYRYQSFDTSKASGVRIEDVGKGLIVYRRCDDGKWRVARDVWSSDNPILAE